MNRSEWLALQGAILALQEKQGEFLRLLDEALERVGLLENAVGAAPMTKTDRKRLAERLYCDGLTMEAIGKVLGVTKKTISLDLRDLIVTTGDNPQPAKTATNPKGGGRPKGSGNVAKPKAGPQPERRRNSPTATQDDQH
jgi:hypothetical protein